LKADVKQLSSDTVPSGKVISSDPVANTQVAKGSTVIVNVSTGPAQVSVPDVTTKTQADATSILQAAGFSVVVQKVVDPVNNGKVKSQNPIGGTKADKGSSVTIVVGTL
jgi:serine/threonine-protein kinase